MNTNNRRPVYSMKNFQNEFAHIIDQTKRECFRKNEKRLLAYIHPRNFLNLFTIVNVVVEYDFRKNFFADLFSGLTGSTLLRKL